MNIPKISVYMITYNQIDVIDRTLKSILVQSDYVYEICISDDHSIDGTWERLLEYSEKYPGLFKLHRNNHNLGIFENTEKVWTMPTGDIVHDLAGDDCVGEGWFKNVIDFILSNKIDFKKELFCIYGDYKCIYPNGDSYVNTNEDVLYNDNTLKLALRGIISNRSACYSINILHKFMKTSQGKSHIAEDAQDRQLQLFSEKNYYIPKVGNIYYTFIGVSSKITEEVLRERALIRPYAFKLFKQHNAKLDKYDMLYSLKYFPVYERFLTFPTIGTLIKMIILYFKCIDPNIKFTNRSLHHFLFAIMRRIPHRKPLAMHY